MSSSSSSSNANNGTVPTGTSPPPMVQDSPTAWIASQAFGLVRYALQLRSEGKMSDEEYSATVNMAGKTVGLVSVPETERHRSETETVLQETNEMYSERLLEESQLPELLTVPESPSTSSDSSDGSVPPTRDGHRAGPTRVQMNSPLLQAAVAQMVRERSSEAARKN